MNRLSKFFSILTAGVALSGFSVSTEAQEMTIEGKMFAQYNSRPYTHSRSSHPQYRGHNQRRGGRPTCKEPGSVYIKEVDGCVQHVTGVAAISRHMPAHNLNDPNCVGRPDGYRYDKKIIGAHGLPGVAHIVCGRRPN